MPAVPESDPSRASHTALLEREWPKNFFDDPVPPLADVLRHERLGRAVVPALEGLLGALGSSLESTTDFRKQIFRILTENPRPEVHERKLHQLFEEAQLIEPYESLVHQRAQQVVAQLRPYMPDGHLLELGSGTGEIARTLARQGHDITLSDEIRFPETQKIGLPFKGLPNEGPLPFRDEQFDGILALTSLHHCKQPLERIREMSRIVKSGGTLVVIETVHGITQMLPEHRTQPGLVNFIGLAERTQRQFNCFFDILASRVLSYHEDPRQKLATPCNFASIQSWITHFDNEGLRTGEVRQLGLDQPLVPGYHALLVLEKV